MRSIIRLFKGAGILNLLGMTVAFAAIYIIMVQVNYDWNYNSRIKDLDRIFIMAYKDWYEEGKYSVNISRPIAESILKQSSIVESYTVIQPHGNSSAKIKKGDETRKVEMNITEVTSKAFNLFSFEAIAGTFDGMNKEKTVAISEKTAKKFNLKPGDIIWIDTYTKLNEQRTVTAIYKGMPTNSLFGNIDLIYCDMLETENIENYSEWSYKYYVKLNSSESIEDSNDNINKIAKSVLQKITDENTAEQSTEEEEYIDEHAVRLFPLDGLQFNNIVSDNFTSYQCNKTTTVTLFVVSILILVITLINYLNFFMAQIPVKLRSVNTKKILGSSRLSLVTGFIIESAILVIVSLLLAYIIIKVIGNSTYAELISCPLNIEENVNIAVLTLCVALIMTISASLYPAMYITSFSPALALKSTMGTARKGKSFRYILVGFQFTISIIFIICAAFIKIQYDYMMNYDMGFDKESLYTVKVPANWNNHNLFTSELQNNIAIKEVAWGDSPLVSAFRMSWGRDFNGKEIYFTCYPVSYNFLRFMGISISEGRDFTESDERSDKGIFIFNKKAKEDFGLTLESKIQGHAGETDIAGFCDDFKFMPLHYKVEPFAFYVFGKNPWRVPAHLYIRSNHGATYNEVQEAVRKVTAKIVPDFNTDEIDLKFFDEELGRQYEKEEKLISLITLFTILAVVISLMGIIGLLMFETKFRRKEIGLRRVHGASIREILEMFNRKFFYILLISFLIAAPVGYIVMDYYYSTFAYRSPLHWWVFLLAFVMVAIITVGVVTLCSYKAASENPAETLKNE